CRGKLLFGPDGATAAQSQRKGRRHHLLRRSSSSPGRPLLRPESDSDLTQDDSEATCVS
ncbi:unnamed protein product, partial [Musa textilis]